jgi:hypothetical protein
LTVPNRIHGLDLLADQIYPPTQPPSLFQKLFFKTVPTPLPVPARVSPPKPEVPAEPHVEGPQQHVFQPSVVPDPVPEAEVIVSQDTTAAQPVAAPTASPVAESTSIVDTKLEPSFLLLLSGTYTSSLALSVLFTYFTLLDLVQYDVPYPLEPFESISTLYRRIFGSPSFQRLAERIRAYLFLYESKVSTCLWFYSAAIYNIFSQKGPRNSTEAYGTYAGEINPGSASLNGWYDFR